MKITLRDLCWLMFLAAIIAGWFVDHRREAIERAEERAGLYEQSERVTQWLREAHAEIKSLQARLPAEE
jgi:hypothetical protein